MAHKNPDDKKIYQRKYKLKTLYGLTIEEYEFMQEIIGPECPICGKEKILYIDHNHNTGKVRGLLCNHCNLMLGKFEEAGCPYDKIKDYLNAEPLSV